VTINFEEWLYSIMLLTSQFLVFWGRDDLELYRGTVSRMNSSASFVRNFISVWYCCYRLFQCQSIFKSFATNIYKNSQTKVKVKVKVKLSLRFSFFLTEQHVRKAYWGAKISPRILNLGTRWRWMVSFTPRERNPGTHWIEVWVGPRAGLDAVMKGKILSLCRNSNPRSSSS
jgi:hypothetical protein